MTTPIAERWKAKESQAQPKALQTGKWRYYKPFVSAVDTYVREAQDGERIYFGIDEFDGQIRGVGRGQLCVINGYSHSGKTLLLAHILRHNRRKRIAMFTPDEPAQLVLAKLASLSSGVPADELEDRIASYDDAAIDILRRTAVEEFPNLIVFEQSCNADMMHEALKEAELVWGEKAELVVFDYLELLQAGETVPAKFEFIKAYGTDKHLPIILIHQTSRSGGKDGAAQTISSGAYGGETFATFQLGVWRKKSALEAQLVDVRDKIMRAANGASQALLDQQEDLAHELERHMFTVTVAITKNKRPGRRSGREEIDFELFGDTGQLVPLDATDLPAQYRQKIAGRAAQLQAQPATEPDYHEAPLYTDEEAYWGDEEPF